MYQRPFIVDGFIFHNELDLLEVRLNTLAPYVDKFILAESSRTFQGKYKGLVYFENRNRFKEFHDKIIYVPTAGDLASVGTDSHTAWEREHEQRRSIRRGIDLNWLNHLQGTILLLSDLDEIPDLRDWEPRPHCCWWLRFYYYYVNMVGASPKRIKGTCSVSLYDFLSWQKYKGDFQSVRDWRHHWPDIIEAGWHFSYLGGEEAIRNKISAFAHTEVAHHNTPENIQHAISTGADLFHRPDHRMELCGDDDLPPYLKENKNRYPQFWYAGKELSVPTR